MFKLVPQFWDSISGIYFLSGHRVPQLLSAGLWVACVTSYTIVWFLQYSHRRTNYDQFWHQFSAWWCAFPICCWCCAVFEWNFPRLVGRGGPRARPACSPDLSSLYFFLWRYVKTVVFSWKPNFWGDFNTRITDAISAVTETHMQKMFMGLKNHIMLCICIDGDHIETWQSQD